MGQLDGKVAVITGGSSGIGKGSVKAFVKAGARVVIADIMDDHGQALAHEMGESAVYLHTDVTVESQIKAAIDLAVSTFGRLDCMFNNAGGPGAEGLVDEITEEGFDAAVALLFRSVFFGIKHAAPVMKSQGGGSIINTASIAGWRTGYGDHLYSACKAAIIHLTRSVSIELGLYNIRTNCICPGGIVSSIFLAGTDLDQDQKIELYGPMEERMAKIQAIKRAGQPEDIAQAAIWLAGDNSSFVNGAAINVDGSVLDGYAAGMQSFANFLELVDESTQVKLMAHFQETMEERLTRLAQEKKG
jgi:NAD(P)-dependent dehydrogenase (short-subunit alcohol dehydrogenase family)